MNTYIEQINRLGQSIWYDNLSREVLRSGELGAIVKDGVSGLTSNPTIFKKAIADTADYDADIRKLSEKGLDDAGICQKLMVEDIREAAKLLLPVYEKTGADDGYASIEVSPLLAADTAGTVAEGKQLWSEVGMPNAMIKVPATAEGIPAISALLAEGINVNVTLIFSVEVYLKVVEAYLSGLEARHKSGGDLSRLSSVASFFVSRVDSICEKRFEALLKEGAVRPEQRDVFWGRIGIANSRLAYENFQKIFNSDRFQKLAKFGARVQRPLWASTGTKNPEFKKTLYVEELIGKYTVNTVPPATLLEIMKGLPCEARVESGFTEAQQVITQTNALGMNFDALLSQLEREGVEAFSQSYDELMASLKQKVTSLG